MVLISNSPTTGFARNVEVEYIKDNIKSKTLEIAFTIKVMNGADEVIDMRYAHRVPVSENQLINPVDGTPQDEQNETNDYIGEYTYMTGEIITNGNVTAAEAKVTRLDTLGVL